MNEKPIERLNYYNGQRLEAADFKLEQDYHIRVRRWLNKSLYSAGIADGLEVQKDKGDPQQVIVSPGLALDSEGREIILLEETRIKVEGQKSEKAGEVEGNYLFIQYREETMAREDDSCTPKSNGQKHKEIPWGGPSRVRAKPILGWSYSLPHESSGKVVLAQVELGKDCKVRNVHTYLRKYIGPASNMLVHQYALEGERHIDKDNPGRIYFHIRGRQPNAVTLYLRAEKFSTLYYTEMGKHLHGLSVEKKVETDEPTYTPNVANPNKYKHSHPPGDLGTVNDGMDGVHSTHSLNISYSGKSDDDAPGYIKIEPFQYQGVAPLRFRVPAFSNVLGWLDDVLDDHPINTLRRAANIGDGSHYHTITGNTELTNPFTEDDHFHTVSPGVSMSNAGVSDVPARSEPDPNNNQPKALTYVDRLQIYIGKADTPLPEPPNKPSDEDNHTDDILNQLDNAQPTVGWLDVNGQGSLGDGKESHALAKNGTGEIRLDLLSPDLSFPPGDYYIQLDVGNGGGRILYNLYVE
jgi:hypothetical protein